MGTVPLSVMESTMRVFKEFDEIKAAVGTEVGVSNWIEVTQERIEQFAQATGDNQWIHVDVERAERELPMGTTIAHGLLTLSFAQPACRCGRGNQIYDGRMADERAASPILGDVAEQAMLDLVPLRGAGRIVADRDR